MYNLIKKNADSTNKAGPKKISTQLNQSATASPKKEQEFKP